MEKAYRYRFYPTPEQDRTLGRNCAHRFLGCVP
ncbi:MAG: hypothetical protein EWV75_06475 [Microcystis wesenbergii Mw_QC_S_20081001_S30D]|uniref:Transposase putative helix-turn-helix domain-containing protein n=1 Tax=Microcystis wesenbergii Mw_QC_S_20081001_S30D TaxID=2486245 RepID=A0A552JS10_9CHRO|nr:MAG: hypothetical protein EWV75_06475 [Microcystis wesenbergii Mw_QC_S_20081001_S30D]TRV04028.1 MAG: hypothetical protein EWV74_05600 [Microcystis wesenbergii Mw_QC_S_20081001_S30]